MIRNEKDTSRFIFLPDPSTLPILYPDSSSVLSNLHSSYDSLSIAQTFDSKAFREI